MRPWLIVLLFLPLAGCLDEPDVVIDPAPPVAVESSYAYAVVGVLDTAINPYHVHFQRNETVPAEVLATFIDPRTGQAPTTVQLSQNGSYDERRDADAEFWDSIQDGKTYHFAGTNIIAVSHGDNIIDGGSHGTATSGAVLDANPDAIIAFSQGFGGASEAWSAEQPWIDFLSESYGPIGSPPIGPVVGSSTADANRAKWNAGGIPVGASDNTPALAPGDSTAGPPWVVGVAGDHDDGCREPMSGNVPDFTADFTQNLPRDRTIDEYGFTSGTSFATPMTAGVFSAVLQQIRSAWNHTSGITNGSMAIGNHEVLDNVGLRDAINRTAVYFSTDSCDGGVPVAPGQPWVSQGWGHVGPEIIDVTVNHILGIEEAPAKPAEAVAYMEAVHESRKRAWS